MEPRALMEQIASLDESLQAALAAFLAVIGEGTKLEDGQGLMVREAELERRGVQVNVKVLQHVARLWSTQVRDRLGQRLQFQESLVFTADGTP